MKSFNNACRSSPAQFEVRRRPYFATVIHELLLAYVSIFCRFVIFHKVIKPCSQWKKHKLIKQASDISGFYTANVHANTHTQRVLSISFSVWSDCQKSLCVFPIVPWFRSVRRREEETDWAVAVVVVLLPLSDATQVFIQPTMTIMEISLSHFSPPC